jgi:hypothetical protein
MWLPGRRCNIDRRRMAICFIRSDLIALTMAGNRVGFTREGRGIGFGYTSWRLEFSQAGATFQTGGTMPTKKEPTRREQEIATRKNHPVAKTAPPAVAQNGEAQPKKRR